MSVTNKLAQLRAYALTAKTCIYNEDAMTAIELAGQTACKVNECVEAINLIIEAIDQLAQNDGLEFIWDETTESLTMRVVEV